MSTKHGHITIQGLKVEVVRKDIKNLHLGVYPPNGRIRVAAPLKLGDEAVRLAVINKLGWIKKQRRGFLEQARQSEREYVSGETHYYLGRPYRLRVRETPGSPRVETNNSGRLNLYISEESSVADREAVISRWYRARLRELAGPVIEKYADQLGVQPSEWKIKRMKTKWGSCNSKARRVWLNLELAKKPLQCIEYIIAHELAHLIEPKHGERFTRLMDRQLPHWRLLKEELNASPLAHDDWEY